MKGKKIALSDDYAAQETPQGIHIFGYFEDEGEIRQDPYSRSVTLADYEVSALAIGFLGLSNMLDEAIGLYVEFQQQHGYNAEKARGAAVLEILEGLQSLEDIAEWERQEANPPAA